MLTNSAIIFLLAGLALTPAISQDTSDPRSQNSHPVITKISVAESGDRVDVEVAFSQLVQPEVSRLEHPDRLVFDFPGCELADPGQRFVVNQRASPGGEHCRSGVAWRTSDRRTST